MTVTIIILAACGAAGLCYAGYPHVTGAGGKRVSPLAAGLLCVIAVLAVAGCATAQTVLPATGALTEADSAAYTGPVTPGVFFRYLNWAGELPLGTLASKTGTQTSQSGTSTGSVSGGFLFLGVAGIGGGSTSGSSASTTQTLPYRAYEFSVINQAGLAIIVTFPATSLEFTQIPAGQKPWVRFVFNSAVFYQKGADGTSVFAADEDPNASGDGPYGGDMGLVFANTPIGVLLGQWVVDVEAGVTARQFAELTDPQLPGVPAS
jgi:hypothetical protein